MKKDDLSVKMAVINDYLKAEQMLSIIEHREGVALTNDTTLLKAQNGARIPRELIDPIKECIKAYAERQSKLIDTF